MNDAKCSPKALYELDFALLGILWHLFQNCWIQFSCHVGNLGLLKITDVCFDISSKKLQVIWWLVLGGFFVTAHWMNLILVWRSLWTSFEFLLNSTFWENTFTKIHNIIFSLLGKAGCYDTRQGKWSSSGSSQTGNITPEVSINIQTASSQLPPVFAPSWPGFLKYNIPAVSSSF